MYLPAYKDSWLHIVNSAYNVMERVKMASLIQYAVLFVALAFVFGVLGKKKIAGASWDIAKSTDKRCTKK
jgi:hypothetical protein